MTIADLIASIAAECQRAGLDAAATEVDLDDGPEGPVLAVGTATRFDGECRLLITSRDYAAERVSGGAA